MADLFKSLKPHAHLSKNGFDLSRKHVVSTKAGEADPCLYVETVPGDHFEIDLAALTRTQTLVTAAFLRGKQRYDFFFVPYSQLWHPFNQFISQRTDKHSTRQQGHNYCPVVSLEDLVIFIFDAWTEQGNYHEEDIHNNDMVFGAIRLLDLSGYGDFRWILGFDEESDRSTFLNDVAAVYHGKYVNIFRLLAFNHVWYDYYRNKYYDVDDNDTIVHTGPQGFDYVSSFNVDDLDCSSFANSIMSCDWTQEADRARWSRILCQHYIQWKKDLFTSTLPSQQFGAVSGVSINDLSLQAIRTYSTDSDAGLWHESGQSTLPSGSVLTEPDAKQLNVGGDLITHNHSLNMTNLSSSLKVPSQSAFDVLVLRRAEALQVWKQNTLRAGNMTDPSFEAHFGVTPYYESDENVNYLGSFSANLNLNTVEATANSSGVNGKVGDLAAAGSAMVQGNKIKFDARDYGVIICVASFLPESEYTSNYLDKANTLYEQFDFFTPEFQNIGLEAVSLHNETIDYGPSNTVIGYAPRYWMYKTSVDRVFGEFKKTRTPVIGGTEKSLDGSLKLWVTPRSDYFNANQGKRLLSSWYVDPRIFNNVMAIAANGYQNTDYLIHNIFFDVKAIRPMSVLGLPEF